VDHKSHDLCFRVFLIEAGVTTFVTHCTDFQLDLTPWVSSCPLLFSSPSFSWQCWLFLVQYSSKVLSHFPNRPALYFRIDTALELSVDSDGSLLFGTFSRCSFRFSITFYPPLSLRWLSLVEHTRDGNLSRQTLLISTPHYFGFHLSAYHESVTV